MRPVIEVHDQETRELPRRKVRSVTPNGTDDGIAQDHGQFV
jgi:hypothetical protein